MSTDWNHGTEKNTPVLYKYAKLGKNISFLCITMAYATPMFFFSLKIIFKKGGAGPTKRSFPYDGYFPFDALTTPWYEIIYFMQTLSTFNTVNGFCGSVSLFAVLTLHLCGQLTLLADELQSLSQDDCIKTNLKKLIQKQNKLNRFAEILEEVFNKTFLAQVFSYILLTCLIGFQLVTAVTYSPKFPIMPVIFMTVYVSYMSTELFCYCFAAEMLKTKSLGLADAIYFSKWYEMNPKVSKDIAFIIHRSQEPLVVTAGKFCSLSHSFFGILTKTALGYLSVLLAVKQKQHSEMNS